MHENIFESVRFLDENKKPINEALGIDDVLIAGICIFGLIGLPLMSYFDAKRKTKHDTKTLDKYIERMETNIDIRSFLAEYTLWESSTVDELKKSIKISKDDEMILENNKCLISVCKNKRSGQVIAYSIFDQSYLVYSYNIINKSIIFGELKKYLEYTLERKYGDKGPTTQELIQKSGSKGDITIQKDEIFTKRQFIKVPKEEHEKLKNLATVAGDELLKIISSKNKKLTCKSDKGYIDIYKYDESDPEYADVPEVFSLTDEASLHSSLESLGFIESDRYEDGDGSLVFFGTKKYRRLVATISSSANKDSFGISIYPAVKSVE